MQTLQQWMDRNGKRDGDVAKTVGVSRTAISRIRRRVATASAKTARRLEKLTGIRWFHFLERQPKPRKISAKGR